MNNAEEYNAACVHTDNVLKEFGDGLEYEKAMEKEEICRVAVEKMAESKWWKS